MTTISPDFDTPGEWLSKCEWVHPKRYYKCPFCELTLAKETNQRLGAKLAALVKAAEPVSQSILPSGDQMKKLKAAISAAKVTP